MDSKALMERATALLEEMEADRLRGQSDAHQQLVHTLVEVTRCPTALVQLAVGQVLRNAAEIKRLSVPPLLAAWGFLRPQVTQHRWLVTDDNNPQEVVRRLNDEAQGANFADRFLSSVGLTDGGFWLSQVQEQHGALLARLDNGRGLPPGQVAFLHKPRGQWVLLLTVSAVGDRLSLHPHSDTVTSLVQQCAEHVSQRCDTHIFIDEG